MSLPSAERTALILLGPHRSDLLVMAQLLGHLGAAVPQDLVPLGPDADPASSPIADLNDRVLRQACPDLSPLPAAWLDSRDAAGLLDEAVSLLPTDVALFVIADAGICRLLPFWRRALAQSGARAVVLLIPGLAPDVVPPGTAQAEDAGLAPLLWARRVLDAEADSRDLKRSWVALQDLRADWRGGLARIGADLGIAWPRSLDEAAADIDAALDRQGPPPRAKAPLPPMLEDIAAILQSWQAGADPGADHDRLDRLRTMLDASAPLLDALARGMAHQSQEFHARIATLQADHDARIAGLQAERDSLRATLRSTSEAVARAGAEPDFRDDQIRDLTARMASLDRQLQVALAQVRQLADQATPPVLQRLDLALALDDPAACSEDLAALRRRVDRANARLEAERAELHRQAEQFAERERVLVAERDAARDRGRQREAELMASLSWRVTAPLRALSRRLRGGA